MLWSRPDNPFLLNYVAYHHFRSLGWVVRSGIKFCVDLLLYKKGPAFSHAEFAVVVLPVYEDPEDAHSSPFGPHPQADHRDWVWFSSVNRVNTQVLKVRCTPVFSHLCSFSLDSGPLLRHHTTTVTHNLRRSQHAPKLCQKPGRRPLIPCTRILYSSLYTTAHACLMYSISSMYY